MDTILLSSGYHEQTLAILRQRWNTLDIPDPCEALDYLKHCRELPLAVAIGHVPTVAGDMPAGHRGLPAPDMLSRALELDADLPVIVSAGEAHARAIVDLVKQGAVI